MAKDLFGTETEQNILNWHQRLQIAVDSAEGPPIFFLLDGSCHFSCNNLIDISRRGIVGLKYLHFDSEESIIHGDMKTSNILLDENFRAKVADFGLSKQLKSDMETFITTTSAGTLGYLDPEHRFTGTLTDKSDVYSFGIILLVLITGRPAMKKEDPDKRNILQWISPWVEKGDIKNIVDKRLDGGFDHSSARKAIDLAMSCVQEAAAKRPDMNSVLVELNECLKIEMFVPVRTSMELRDNMADHSETRSPIFEE